MKRLLSIILVLAVLLTCIPMQVFATQEVESDTITVSNDYIQLIVNKKNGGFTIKTVEGNRLIKGDENKNLLYRNDEFDTSFTTFRVKDGGDSKDYIFGNKYGFLGFLLSDKVEVTSDATGVNAVWKMGDMKITQRLELVANEQSNEHGTVRIGYEIENTGKTPLNLQSRILLDTLLGNQDYGYYEVPKTNQAGGFDTIEKETTFSNTDVPANYSAVDNKDVPTSEVYSVNEVLPDVQKPYQMTFAHWNNIAATTFDYTADPTMYFTNDINKKYETADSAVGLYYDLGSIAPGAKRTFSTYYGVNSNVKVKNSDSIAINLTAPAKLELNNNMDAYLDRDGNSTGMFEISTKLENFQRAAARKYDKVRVAAFVDDCIVSLNENGVDNNYTNQYPFQLEVSNFDVGQVKPITFKFKGKVSSETSYQKVVFRAYDMPDSAQGLLLKENIIGSAETYILFPGGNGELPQITFSGANPKILYNDGKRHFTVTGKGFGMLNKQNVTLLAKSNTGKTYTIPFDNISLPETGVMDILFDQKMEAGQYNLEFQWQSGTNPQGIDPVITAPALNVVMVEDEQYKNTSYGVLAVEKNYVGGLWKYSVKTFDNQAAYDIYRKANAEKFDKGEIPLTISGDLKEIGTTGSNTYVGNVKGNETVVINGTIDFKDGSITIVDDKNGTVKINNNGTLKTSGSCTTITEGESYIELLANNNYIMSFYNDKGEQLRAAISENGEKGVKLQWPGVIGLLQTIAGFAIDFKYGDLGIMGTENPSTGLDKVTRPVIDSDYIMSFGGKLDLSFLMPGGVRQAEEEERKNNEKFDQDMRVAQSMSGGGVKYKNTTTFKPSAEATAEDDKNAVDGKIVGEVKDVLYGQHDGKSGLIGVNANLEIVVPKIVDALPSYMAGKLDINTINGYNVGFEGATKLANMEVDFSLRVRSAPNSNIPIPDKLYFFIAGFEPGLMVAPPGALWITGGGGGIDKLYETIYSKSAVPPLTVLLSVQFDVFKVMTGRADLEVSARHFKLKFSDMTLKKIESVKFLDGGSIGVTWYPDFSFNMNATVAYASLLKGTISISAYSDFFEMLLRVGVFIPDEIPLLGGIEVASAEIGGGTVKMWGKIRVMGIPLGITYYWSSGRVEFGVGSSSSIASLDNLSKAVPVAYDAKNDRTLFMCVGNNLKSQVISDSSGSLDYEVMRKLYAANTTNSNQSNNNFINMTSSNDTIISVSSTQNGIPASITDATSKITVKAPNGSIYPLKFYDPTKDDTYNADANANLTTNAAGDKTIAFTIQKDQCAIGMWSIVTSFPAQVAMAIATPIAEITSCSAIASGKEVTANWEGASLAGAKVDMYITSDKQQTGLKLNTSTVDATVQQIKGQIPDEMQTGKYYVRLVLQKEGEVYQSYFAQQSGKDFMINYKNVNAPSEPKSTTLTNAGNNMLKINVVAQDENYDGYIVDIYEKQGSSWNLTGVSNQEFTKNEAILVGGQFQLAVPENTSSSALGTVNYGFNPGSTYKAVVTTYRTINNKTYRSAGVISGEALLKQYSAPSTTVSDALNQAKLMYLNKPADKDNVLIFNTSNVSLKLDCQTAVTGILAIDGKKVTDMTNVKSTIVNAKLADGMHKIEWSGQETDDGDGFLHSQCILVDTTAPRIMLQNPLNGSLFNTTSGGSINISGQAEEGAFYTFSVDGKVVADKVNLDQYINNGYLDYDLTNIGIDTAVKKLTIKAEDVAGNSTSTTVTINNKELTNIKRVFIESKTATISGGAIAIESNSAPVQLQLVAFTYSGNRIVLNDESIVEWKTGGVSDCIKVNGDGFVMPVTDGNNYVVGSLRVAQSAGYTDAIVIKVGKGSGDNGNPKQPDTIPDTSNTLPNTINVEAGSDTSTKTISSSDVQKQLLKDGKLNITCGNVSISLSKETLLNLGLKDSDSVSLIITPYSAENNSLSDCYKVALKIGNQIITDLKGNRIVLRIKSTANNLTPKVQEPVAVSVDKAGKAKLIKFCVFDWVKKEMILQTDSLDVVGTENNIRQFADINGHWGRDAIAFVTARELFEGIGNNRFGPNGSMSRAMLVTVLGRLSDVSPGSAKKGVFSDVPANAYYSAYVQWAVEQHIASGVGKNKFQPDKSITREEMAVMIYNYLKSQGYNLDKVATASYVDGAKISSWAKDSVKALYEMGILTAEKFNPKDKLSRAEFATILKRLIEKEVK